jgi:hypothetical protein
MKTKISMLIILLIAISNQVLSQENYFKISGQYRARTEFRNGYRTLVTDSSKSAFFISQRARIVLDFKNEKIQLYTSIQDARTWGDEEQKKDLSGLQVNEIWTELKIKKGFSVKLGRQELAYDDHRLLGNLDWANLTISHDALLVKYFNAEKKIRIHVGGAFNQFGEPISGTTYTLKNYKTLGLAWIKKEFNNGHTLSGLTIANGLNSTNINEPKLKFSYTLGPLYNYNNKSWKVILGAYYQGGKLENGSKLNAFMINGYGEKKIKDLALGLGVDYLSGNKDNANTSKSKSFSTLYATNHKFYGFMDYFLNIPTDTKQRGLTDIYAKIGYTFTDKISTSLDIHQFLLSNKNHTGSYNINKALGVESDILLDYKPSSLIHVQLGYSFIMASKNMEYLKGGNADDFNTWAYLMLKISPTLFNHEIK